MKKIVKRVLLGLLILIGILFTVFIIMFWNPIRSVFSLKQVNKYPFYTMTYYGDYGFDDFLKVGAKNDDDLVNFALKDLLHGYDMNFQFSKASCTCFTASTEDGDRIFGRNFDFPYSPGLLIRTKPDHGYASVSMVNLSFLGYSKKKLPRGFNAVPTLIGPYLPFDGMNEKGVTVACMATRDEPQPIPAGKTMLNTTTVMRLVLDKAASLEEALDLLKDYDVYFSQDIVNHYLIADAEGNSAVVEFAGTEMKVLPAKENYQVCTNFALYRNEEKGNGLERYQEASKVLKEKNGVLSEQEAMDLLDRVNIRNYLPSPDYDGDTQWSIVFNQTDLTLDVVINKNFDKVYSYSVK